MAHPALERRYELDAELSVIRVTREVVRDADKILEASVSAKGQHIKDCFIVQAGGKDAEVDVYAKREYSVLWLQLPRLKIKTTFQLVDGVLLPRFVVDRQLLQVECVWTPPENMYLNFLLAANVVPGVGWKAARPFLFATKTGTRDGFWKLPITNTFDDGQMCLGERFDHLPVQSTQQELLLKVLDILDASPWNADLLDRFPIAMCHDLFRFDPATLKSLPPRNDPWQSRCVKCSHPHMVEVMP